jgi:MFS family permease
MSEISAGEEWRAHWPLVVAGFFGSALNVLPAYALGVLLAPVVKEFGWTRGEYFFGLSLSGIMVAALVPFTGRWIDRKGSRSVAIPGVVIHCVTFAALALSGAEIWQWWGIWAIHALGAAMITTNVWTGPIAANFDKSRGSAMAVALAGSGFAAAITPLLMTGLIDAFNWRTACIISSAIFLAVLLPLTFLCLKDGPRARTAGTPADVAQPKTGLTLAEGLRAPSFIKLAVASVLIFVPLLALVIHFVPIARADGLKPGEAAVAAGAIGLASLSGRLVAGPLLDRIQGRFVAAAALVLPIVATLMLLAGLAHSPGMAALIAALLGGALGAYINILAYLSGRYWGMRSYATLFGLLLSCLAISQAIGPTLAGHVFDVAGSYRPFLLWVALPAFIVAMLLIATLGRYPDFARAEVAAQ